MTHSKKITVGDIDIDCVNRDQILELIEYIPAKLTTREKHKTGVYIQGIEIDTSTGYADLDYEKSPYTKIDFLNLNTLNYFSSNKEIEELISKEPNWNLLKIREIVRGFRKYMIIMT